MTAFRLALPSYSVFAATIATAGLPIYIHAPKFYVDSYGVGLAALGTTLFGLRLLDFVQDPALGWLSRKTANYRGTTVLIASLLMGVAMVGLFAISPPTHPLLWFGITLAILFSAFSFLTITFYAQGVRKAGQLGRNGHVRLAAWRETGALVGVSLAAVAPVAFLALSASPFALFSYVFAMLVVLAVIAMHREWEAVTARDEVGIRVVLGDSISRRLLFIALLNAAPVAVTSTLFLFYVEGRLGAAGWEGPLLLLFFLSAALSAPIWARVANRIGAKNALLMGMTLAIVSFGGAAFLAEGDVIPFAIVCAASGASLGADLTLLPAIFAKRLAKIVPEAAEGFGLWSFVSKFTLALAAVVLLPLLEASGFQPGSTTAPDRALFTLAMMYAVLPCALKLIAITLLVMTPLDELADDTAMKEV